MILHNFKSTVPMAEWLRPLPFSALNHSDFHHCGPSLARNICETNQVLPAGSHVFFLDDLPFLPHLAIGSSRNE